MALTCPRCHRTIEYSGERPSFCAYCGQALAPTTEGGSTELTGDATVDYKQQTPTQVLPGGSGARGVPESIAGYRLVRKLGQGGMGSVHEAVEEVSGRRVALKLIAPEYTASATAVERFLQEGRLASGIAHPRCVFVLAADQADGWPYIVMELMPGHTLKDLVEREGPLPQGEAVRKIMDVIEGLDEAHKLGVIHRDVKPSNCFLDEAGRVKVGDFGLSKSMLGSDANLTRTGSFLGTPHYAAPEQIKGERADATSDVYSVAATLYYLLTGKPPFEASDATVAMARILTEQAPSVRSIRPEVWLALDRVVLRGLERDRRRRFRDLEEFREALAPFLPGRVALGRVGLRVGAYILDFLVTLTIIAGLYLVFEAIGHDSSRPITRHRGPDWNADLLAGIVVTVYFALFEVASGASIGKRAFRLRVVAVPRGGPLSWSEAIARLAVFLAIVIIPRRIYTLVFAPSASPTVYGLATLIQLLSYPMLFVTARGGNGYRGLHDTVAGTAVVVLPGLFRRRRRGQRPVEPPPHVARPEGLPGTVGPFKVDGALVWSDERRLLLGEDTGLGRAAWISMRPNHESGPTDVRRDLGRLSRPRWLNSGEADGWAWDAFVAPSGGPLPDLIAAQGPLDWHEARLILEELAAELEAAEHDGTLPDVLAIPRVWVQPDGRAILIDAPLDPYPETHFPIDDPDPPRRSLELLRRAATCLLGGRATADRSDPAPVGSPVPGHVIDALDRLTGFAAPYTSVSEFRADLDATRERPAELTPTLRFAHAGYTFVSIALKTWLIPTIVVVYTYAVSALAGEPIADIPERVFDRIILFQSFLWVLVSMTLRAGVGGLIWGVTIVRSDGRHASRLRLGWREALIWLPLFAVDYLFDEVPIHGRFAWYREWGTLSYALIAPFLFLAPAALSRGIYLNDRLARTAVVPR